MKKGTIYFLLIFLSAGAVQAQIMQASLGIGTRSNRLKLYIRPTGSQATASISTLQFNVAIPAGVAPRPNLSIIGNTTATFQGIDWRVDQLTESGYHNYYITTAQPQIVINNLAAGTEYEMMEVEFTNGTASTNASLLTHVDGGSNFNLLFLCTGTIQSDGSNLYYTRSGVVVNNLFSYDINNTVSGTGISSATLGGVTLPVTWLGFNAVRHVNDVRLTWDVSNEVNVDRYELEVSTNGADFVRFATVPKVQTPGTDKTYAHLDVQVARYSAKKLHYRIKQFDKDGRFSYSPTKTVRLDVKGETALYPNPAKDGFTLTVPYLNANQERVQLQLVNGLGQVVERRDITRLAAANYYFNLNSSLVTSGEYLLKIYEDGELMETKKVSVKK